MSVGLWDCVHLTSVLGGGAWLPSLPASPNASQPAQPEAADLQKWDADLKPALRAWHWRRKGLASVINILAQALYSLFGADGESRGEIGVDGRERRRSVESVYEGSALIDTLFLSSLFISFLLPFLRFARYRTSDEDLEVLREGCFKYFELGGECVGGPVSLLSG